jgi:hypothetical protein
MGEKRACGESGEGNIFEPAVFYVTDDHLPIIEKANHLNSFGSDRLKCVHTTAVSYNKCKYAFTLEAALMIRSIGEINA